MERLQENSVDLTVTDAKMTGLDEKMAMKNGADKLIRKDGDIHGVVSAVAEYLQYKLIQSKMKTLIVEDNKTSGKLLQAVLESEGFETELADDGQEALNVLENHKVDCIISDIMMPNVDGYRLIYKVRKNEKFKDIPFIMYTSSYGSKDDEQFAVSLGANKYIHKRGTTKDIVKAIRELIESRNHPARTDDKIPARDQWVKEKYGKLLIDKLEQRIDELEKTKREFEWNEKKLVEAYKAVEARTHEVNEALKKEKALVSLKSQFISVTSHEFKTPLASINFHAGMLKKFRAKISEKDVTQRLESIEQQTKFISDLLDDVLLMEALSMIN